MSEKAIEVIEHAARELDISMPFGEVILAALKAARIAVVELPESDEIDHECEPGLRYLVKADNFAVTWWGYRDEVQVAYDGEPLEPLDSVIARDIAAALLAVADAAEAVSDE